MGIRYRRTALADLEEIRSFNRKSNPHAAQRVIAEIRSRVDGLARLARDTGLAPLKEHVNL